MSSMQPNNTQCPVCGATLPRKPVHEAQFFEEEGQIIMDGKVINLRGVKFRVFQCLFNSLGMVCSRTQMHFAVYKDDEDRSPKLMDVIVCSLRKFISENNLPLKIESVYRKGWRMTDVPQLRSVHSSMARGGPSRDWPRRYPR